MIDLLAGLTERNWTKLWLEDWSCEETAAGQSEIVQ